MEKSLEAEKSKVGILRAGNTGLLIGDKIIGKCARLTYLRFKGVNVEQPDYSRELMFAGGHSNEDHWIEVLKAADPSLAIRREEEIPIRWTTPSNQLVTGRPDIVLGRMDGEQFIPEQGIELKLVSSLWTARDVGVELSPKMMHLVQAAHYSWQLGIPFELWYTSRTDFAIMGWAQKHFPKPGQAGSHLLEYNEKGEVKKILPFIQGYQLTWSPKDQLLIRPVVPGRETPWEFTPITKKGIQDYFEFISRMGPDNQIGPRPTNMKADGSAGSFSICSYCPLSSACDSYEGNRLDEWEEIILKFLANQPISNM